MGENVAEPAGTKRGFRRLVMFGRLAGAFVAALLVLFLLPLSGNGEMPSVRILLLGGLAVSAIMSVTLHLLVTKDLGLPARVGVYGGVFCALLAVVKLVLGPLSYYQANQEVEFDDITALSTGFNATLAAWTIFILYAVALLVLLKIVGSVFDVRRSVRRRPAKLRVGVLVLITLICAVLGGVPALIVLIPVFFAGPYLGFVFGSAAAGLVVLSLATAAGMVGMVFKGAAERERAVAQAGLLVSAFWVILGFIALYHVLWVVWMLLLTSAWPLKVVTTK